MDHCTVVSLSPLFYVFVFPDFRTCYGPLLRMCNVDKTNKAKNVEILLILFSGFNFSSWHMGSLLPRAQAVGTTILEFLSRNGAKRT